MKVKCKFDKFQGSLNPIRWEHTPYVAFIVYGKDISVLQNPVDFDRESDVIIENLKKDSSSKAKYAFRYRVGVGFEEVDADSQTWFDFK